MTCPEERFRISQLLYVDETIMKALSIIWPSDETSARRYLLSVHGHIPVADNGFHQIGSGAIFQTFKGGYMAGTAVSSRITEAG